MAAADQEVMQIGFAYDSPRSIGDLSDTLSAFVRIGDQRLQQALGQGLSLSIATALRQQRRLIESHGYSLEIGEGGVELLLSGFISDETDHAHFPALTSDRSFPSGVGAQRAQQIPGLH